MSGHEWLAQAAPYALGALDSAERVAFEAHLAGCTRCQTEVRGFAEALARVAETLPTPEPAPALRERVLAEAHRVRPARFPWPRRRGARGWLAAAASLVLALGAGAGWWIERQGHRATSAALAQRDSLLVAVLAPDVVTTALAPAGRPPSARLFYNRARQLVVMAAFDLPPAPAGRTYQLWGIVVGQAPASLGTFNTGADGRGTTALSVPSTLAITTVAVTEEPAGGSPQPTQTPFLVGQLQLN